MKLGVATAEGAIPRESVEVAVPVPVVERRTRSQVLTRIHQSGQLTAAELAQALGLSTVAVRRHLDALIADGSLREVDHRWGTAARGRGRPARAYALSESGRAGFGHGYDDLAATALRYLRETGGEQAVTAFARHRAATLADRMTVRFAQSAASAAVTTETELQSEPDQRVAAVVAALSAEGYAAQLKPAGVGEQICQHHCPVAQVAAEFPQLCSAETEALAAVLGRNVQRLATIAHGDGVCTTYLPPIAGRAMPAPTADVDEKSNENQHVPAQPLPGGTR